MAERAPPPVRNVLITGQPGVGKTTLIAHVVEKLREKGVPLAGFYTEEVRKGDARQGFDVVTMGGERAPLSRVAATKAAGAPRVGRYGVDVPGFEALALPVLEARSEAQVVAIDEIGKMELLSPPFRDRVLECMDDGAVVLASVPMPRYGHRIAFVEDLKARPDAAVVRLLKGNRDEARGAVLSALERMLAGERVTAADFALSEQAPARKRARRQRDA